ncbi:hypothetical protein F9C11_32190 [Amycolatopsis sp. VS8301801F10]|uniref:hypothetical protein n=1 Tax=Amycolatopsis sp. VS8301801F10 TaxID=2652442 RepID=UPI0038FC399E
MLADVGPVPDHETLIEILEDGGIPAYGVDDRRCRLDRERRFGGASRELYMIPSASAFSYASRERCATLSSDGSYALVIATVRAELSADFLALRSITSYMA